MKIRPESTPPLLLAGLLATLLAPACASAEGYRVTLRGRGAEIKAPCPVVAEVSAELPAGPASLSRAEGGPTLPADVIRDGSKTYLALIVESLKQDEVAHYTLTPRSTSPDGPRVSLSGDATIDIHLRNQPFTKYLMSGNKPILYPVLGPSGAKMTRSYPMAEVAGEDRDHPHQRSFWFTHGNVNGLDFWGSDPLNKPTSKSGTIRQKAKECQVGGDAVGVVRTSNAWVDPDEKTICEDERTLRFYGSESPRIIDFDIVLKATAGPVTFGDTKEGAFGLRVASSMDVKRGTGGKITNAEGITDAAAWGKPSPWVDYTGPVEGRTLGIAILNHPDSFRYPTTWHVRDYGLFAANPFGWHDFGLGKSGEYTIPAGGSIRLRYRVLLHEGDTKAADIPAAFKAYANPPTVEVSAVEK